MAGTTRTPGLRRMMARAGRQSTFTKGCEDLKVYAGIAVSAKNVERVAKTIGEQMEQWSKRKRGGNFRQTWSYAIKRKRKWPIWKTTRIECVTQCFAPKDCLSVPE